MLNPETTKWPALALESPLTDDKLVYARGVWGKVHGVASDYRWIAMSANFDPVGLVELLNVGSEDKPRVACYWRTTKTAFYAVKSYPSRAVDASLRSGFIEKQAIQWKRMIRLPAALVALTLLPEVATFNDAIWWDFHNDIRWDRPEFALSIESNIVKALEFSNQTIAESIQKGVDRLKAVVGESALAYLYMQILTDQKPSFLLKIQEPLAPESLAVLTLPLRREIADSLSVVGWMPSSRIDYARARWDVVVLPSEKPPIAMPAALSPNIKQQAVAMAKALLSNNPAPLAQWNQPAVFTQKPKQDRETHFELPPYLKAIEDFAKSDHCRWLDPTMLQRIQQQPLGVLSSQEKKQLWRWYENLKDAPINADKDQWQVKQDIFKALLLALDPSVETFHKIELDENSRIPALFFAPLRGENELQRIYRDIYSKLVQHSKRRVYLSRVEDKLSESVKKIIDS